MNRLRKAVVWVCVLVLAACGGGGGASPTPGSSEPGAIGEAIEWTLPPDPMGLAEQAGLTPDRREFGDFHIHAHLDVFFNGAPVKVPGGIGIEITDPDVRAFPPDEYGGIPEEGCAQVCISPLHTHDADGVIHIEAPEPIGVTLGQFFQVMGVSLDSACVDDLCTPETPVVVYVDGQPQSGDPAQIVLRDLQQISIVLGTPPAVIPDSWAGE